MTTDFNMFQMILFSALIILIYFIPNWIAISRKHHNADAIFATNLFLGWTFIGWIVSLIWSLTAVTKEVSENVEMKKESKQCPYCAEPIRVEAKVCRYCNRDI